MRFYVQEISIPKDGGQTSILTHEIINEDVEIALNDAFSTYHSICGIKRADNTVKHHICTITAESGAQVIGEAYEKKS